VPAKVKINLAALRPKPTEWLFSTLRDHRQSPEDVQDALGRALMVAEFGEKDGRAKPLRGFSGVYQISAIHDDGNTYRLAYTVAMPLIIYVLHVWTKKSHFKDQTDKHDTDRINDRVGEIEKRYIGDVERNYGVTIVQGGKGEYDVR
jgi:phage-related protein